MKKQLKMIALIAAGVMMLTVLTGCSSDAQPTVTTAPTSAPTNTSEVIPAAVVEEATEAPEQPTTSAHETPTTAPQIADGLDDTQRNSIIMLNYLAVLTQEINASQNSRLYLENAYSTLINNTYPNAVDSRTLSQLTSLLDTLERYRMVAVKRERLEYVYEQNRAQAIRSAVPNPLGLLSAVRSNDNKVRVNSILGLAASVVYMAVDSYTSYESQSSQADLQSLQNGWALDDEAATALHNSRRDTFSYMIRIVGDYDLPGDLALSESAVDEFVAWENNSNVVQRIQFLEANVKTYQALGTHWLVLAESYFENGQYDKCLNAVASYEALGARIFRKDYEYARILPLAIISAGEVLDGDKYLAAAEDYIQKILDNTDYDDWASRYFAAQAYVELYARTNDSAYLRSAYEIVLNNVNSLVNEQKAMNAEYLAPVVTVEAPKGATKEQKDDIKKYNDLLKAERKTALPPVNKPLRLNCELLFALADKLQLSEQEQLLIENILHEKGQSIFLTTPIDNQYWFSPVAIDVTEMETSFDGKALTVPASFVSASSVITVTVGVSDDTAKRWLQVLEKSDVIFFLRPYSNNLLKRMVKTPKMYFFDTGLVAYLTRYSSPEILANGAINGAILENYAVAELIKSYHNNAKECLLWYYRDKSSNEINLVLESDGMLHPLEIKRSVNPGSELLNAFQLLDKASVPRGNGAVLCMRPALSAIDAENFIVPVWMI